MILKSYDGKDFKYDDTFINPYEEYGINHNKLFCSIENRWKSYMENNQINEHLMDLAISEAEKITNKQLTEVGVTHAQFKEAICLNIVNGFRDTYIETVQDFFSKFGRYYYESFIYDIVDFAYNTEEYKDAFHKISLIEQKYTTAKYLKISNNTI